MDIKEKAPESYQVQKARKKLIKQMEAENMQINEKSIDQMKKAIQIWIHRHQSERVTLQDRPIKLFDENSNPAKTKSKFVNEMLSNLQNEKEAETLDKKSLAGRIRSKNLQEND